MRNKDVQRLYHKQSLLYYYLYLYIHYLNGVYLKERIPHPELKVSSYVSLNGRPEQEMIRSDLVLNQVDYDRGMDYSWLVPLEPHL